MAERPSPGGTEGEARAGLREELRLPLACAAFAAVPLSLLLAMACLMFGTFGSWWAIALFALLGAVLAVGAAVNYDRVLAAFSTRRAAAGMSVTLAVTAGLVILVGVNWISYRRLARVTWDITEDRKFTLSLSTRRLIEKLEEGQRKLRIVSFLPYQAPPYSGLPPDYMAQVSELLELYSRSDSITVTITNPEKGLSRTEATAKEIGLTLDGIPKDAVVLKYGEKRKDVGVSEIFQTFPPMGPYSQPRPAVFRGEDAFTSAIRDVLDDTERKVYFVTGHGERPSGGDPAAYGMACGALRGMNFRIEDVNLAGRGGVPEDTNVLVIAGPTAPIVDAELDAVERWLDEGGKLLVTLDLIDRKAGQAQSGLERLLRKYGVEVHQDVMAVGREMSFMSVTAGIPSPYHEISEPLARRQAFLRQACVLATASSGDPGLKEGYDPQRILEGTGGSWGERDLSGPARYSKGEDVAGPTTLGIAVGPAEDRGPGIPAPPGKARIVVFSDADFLSNRLLGDPGVRYAANSDLFVNSVNWMAGKTENIGIAPREQLKRKVSVTPAGRTRVFWGTGVLPALAMVALGIAVWRLRAR